MVPHAVVVMQTFETGKDDKNGTPSQASWYASNPISVPRSKEAKEITIRGSKLAVLILRIIDLRTRVAAARRNTDRKRREASGKPNKATAA